MPKEKAHLKAREAIKTYGYLPNKPVRNQSLPTILFDN